MGPSTLFVGGLGLHATVRGKVNWDKRAVEIGYDVHLPRVRENGTVRDLDVLVQSTDAADIQKYKEALQDVLGSDMVISTFGLRRYEQNRRGLLDFTGDRYADEQGQFFGDWLVSKQKSQQMG